MVKSKTKNIAPNVTRIVEQALLVV